MKRLLVAALVLGFSNTYASSNSYFPPERIECGVSVSGQLKCNEFEHRYLTETAYIPNLNKGIEEVYYFVSGSAFFTPNEKEFSVFYTYKNDKMKTVKLKTVNNNIRPDFKETGWRKLSSNIYTCQAGYLQCPITNLPAVS